MRGVFQPEGVPVTQSTEKLHSGMEVFAAEIAGYRGSFQPEGAVEPEGIAEFPGFVGEILFGDEVFRNVPAFEIAGKDKLRLDFALPFQARLTIGRSEVFLGVVTYDFLQTLVGPVDVFELDVEHGIDPMFSHVRPKAVLPAPAGEERAVAAR